MGLIDAKLEKEANVKLSFLAENVVEYFTDYGN